MRKVRPVRRGGVRSFKQIKNSVIFWVVRASIGLFGLLHHRLAVLVGRGLGLLAWLVARRERARAIQNLRSQTAVSVSCPRKLVREMFDHLGQSAMECVVMHRFRHRLGRSDGPVRFTPGSEQVLGDAVAEGRGVLFVTAHIGNWELMAATVALRAPVTVLFKPSYDPRFTRLIADFRLKNGVMGLEVTRPGHLKRAVRKLRQGHVLGVLLDQPVETGVWVPFLGRNAPTSLVVPFLSRITGAPVVVGVIHRQGPCQHAISIARIHPDLRLFDPVRATLLLTRHLERAIKQHPGQWIWSLDRWRSTESRSLSSPFANCIPASNN